MLLQISVQTFNFMVYALGSIAIIFVTFTLGEAIRKARRLKMNKLLNDLGIDDIEY